MFEAWSQDAVNKETSFNLGTNVNLTCANKMWADILYIIWEINLKNRNCKISFINDSEGTDSCNDGKSLQKASTGQLYLHIPKISADDVGVYKCESVYFGGNENHNFKVAVTVRASSTT
ncbi:hypothetical protein CHARACLAT_028311 [Characodon lateralis]|uniref:Ig-like domain-containing protein n=1 Tax=Characodon lateralis TaxID=208331 RepID=A0ABU7DUW6_9TELE|nr:hypothetical protein [Characodon lateralis]